MEEKKKVGLEAGRVVGDGFGVEGARVAAGF